MIRRIINRRIKNSELLNVSALLHTLFKFRSSWTAVLLLPLLLPRHNRGNYLISKYNLKLNSFKYFVIFQDIT